MLSAKELLKRLGPRAVTGMAVPSAATLAGVVSGLAAQNSKLSGSGGSPVAKVAFTNSEQL